MIPKIIHYCWFGNNPIPMNLKKCIDSWTRNLPDYKIIEWNESNYDVNSEVWTREAYEQKKYAFVADYVRLKALYEYGGIYLDTDVEVKKSFDSFLNYKAFGGFETLKTLTTGVIGAEKHNNIILEFLNYYKNRHFIQSDGSIDNNANVLVFTDIMEKHGLVMNNTEQIIDGFNIFPKTYFCPLDVFHYKDITKNTHAIHYFEGSWLDDETKSRIKKESAWYYKLFMRFLGFGAKIKHKFTK